MTQITEASTREILDQYGAVWGESDAAARRDAIARLWEPDGVEYVEGIQFRGYQELDDRITHAYEQFIATGQYIVTMADDAVRHDDLITFTVQFSNQEEEIVWSARVFILVGETGRIREDYQLTIQPLVV